MAAHHDAQRERLWRRLLGVIVAGGAGGATAARDWSVATAGEPMQHVLDSHHASFEREQPPLDAPIRKVLGAHGARHAVTLDALQALEANPHERIHLESNVFFPADGRLGAGDPA